MVERDEYTREDARKRLMTIFDDSELVEKVLDPGNAPEPEQHYAWCCFATEDDIREFAEDYQDA